MTDTPYDPDAIHVPRSRKGASVSERRFPIQGFPLGVPWSAAERAYEFYTKQYGKSQSLERLAERGGFDLVELAHFYLRKRFRDDHAFDVRYIGEALTEILRGAAAPEISDAALKLEPLEELVTTWLERGVKEGPQKQEPEDKSPQDPAKLAWAMGHFRCAQELKKAIRVAARAALEECDG